jgi:hypothetical protein
VRIKIEDRKTKRLNFLNSWKPLRLEGRLAAEDIEKLRLLKYENLP